MLNRGPARLARSTGAVSGVLVIVLGLWGAVVPFVGPYFGYAFGSHATWHYSANRFWLDILPGALAVLAGLVLAGASTRRAGVLAGWLGIAAGAWFVVGAAVSLTWEHGGAGPIGAPLGGDVRRMLELVGYFYGLGAVIVALVAFASGRFASRPELQAAAPLPGQRQPAPQFAWEPATPTAAATAGASTPTTTQPHLDAPQPRARRSAFRRRRHSTSVS